MRFLRNPSFPRPYVDLRRYPAIPVDNRHQSSPVYTSPRFASASCALPYHFCIVRFASSITLGSTSACVRLVYLEPWSLHVHDLSCAPWHLINTTLSSVSFSRFQPKLSNGTTNSTHDTIDTNPLAPYPGRKRPSHSGDCSSLLPGLDSQPGFLKSLSIDACVSIVSLSFKRFFFLYYCELLISHCFYFLASFKKQMGVRGCWKDLSLDKEVNVMWDRRHGTGDRGSVVVDEILIS